LERPKSVTTAWVKDYLEKEGLLKENEA